MRAYCSGRPQNNVVIIPETSVSPPKLEFSQKALRNPKVEFANSRSKFGDYMYKMVRHHEKTVNTE